VSRNSSINHDLVMLLTACIDPGNVYSVARRDPVTRLNDYMQSVKYFLQLPGITNIVFCENSGVDLADIREAVRLNNPYHKNLEVLSFYGQPDHPEYGKGYGEMCIIEYALNHSKSIQKSKMILKISGRLIIANVEAIAKAISKTKCIDVFCDLRQNLSTSDSRFFCATPRFLREYFMPFQKIMNESKGICFEDVLARAVHCAMADGLRWSMLPYAHDMRGVAATADIPIPSSRLRFISREIFRTIKAMMLTR
jgi:hypothetical protein